MNLTINEQMKTNPAARRAIRRYGIPYQAVAEALAEANRSRARGGLSALGSILEQNRIVCASTAMELNRLELQEPELRRKKTRRLPLQTEVPRLWASSGGPPSEETLQGWMLALDRAWARLQHAVLI